MNREEIETRIEICERRANAYNEIGNTKIVHKYENEKYKWEKLLSDLDLLNKKKINELLEYKKAYYKQKEVIDNAIEYVEHRIVEDDYMLKVDTDMVQKELLDILKEVSE